MFFSGYLLYILLTYKALYAKRTSMPDVLFLCFIDIYNYDKHVAFRIPQWFRFQSRWNG